MPSTATPNLLQDPGYLFWAPLATALPVNTVVGSVFTDAWPVGFVNLGATEDGSEFKSNTSVEAVRVAEIFDPIRWNTVDRTSSIAFALADITLNNLKRVMNGGTIATVSGATTTLLSKFTPPAAGSEVRCMIGWESLDATIRLICYQCFQGGETSLANKRRPAKATLAATFNLEKPTATEMYEVYTAGTARVGT